MTPTLDGVDVKPHDTLYYQPTAGPEVEGEVRHVTDEGLDVVVEGRSIGLGLDALREADAEGRLRIEPAAGRVGEGTLPSEEPPEGEGGDEQ